jgi:tetraacyldisaccharide 4'-kinase
VADPGEVGDEAVMLAQSFGGPVVTAARRVDGAAALDELGCDVVVLDDGFQHRAIARAFDIVLVDGARAPLLPAGPGRERLAALRRADAVVLVEREGLPSPPVPDAAAGKFVARARIEPSALVAVAGHRWKEQPLALLAGRRVVAVSGIARPEGFYEDLRRWEAVLEEVFEFPDHHRYTQSDWQRITRRGHDADFVVTTEKDLVKLSAFPFATGKLVALRIVPQVDRAEELIDCILDRAGLSALCSTEASNGDQS